MKRGLSALTLATVLAGLSVAAQGIRGVEEAPPTVIPAFAVDVVVGPAEGAIHIPPSEPPSRPYQAVVTVRTMPNTGSRRIVSDAVYAGERGSAQGRLGPYDIRMAVEIDADGERAEVILGMVQDKDGTQVFSHGFVAHLPASQFGR